MSISIFKPQSLSICVNLWIDLSITVKLCVFLTYKFLIPEWLKKAIHRNTCSESNPKTEKDYFQYNKWKKCASSLQMQVRYFPGLFL